MDFLRDANVRRTLPFADNATTHTETRGRLVKCKGGEGHTEAVNEQPNAAQTWKECEKMAQGPIILREERGK